MVNNIFENLKYYIVLLLHLPGRVHVQYMKNLVQVHVHLGPISLLYSSIHVHV